MSTRLAIGTTSPVEIDIPHPLSSLTLVATRVSDGTAVTLGEPENPSGDGLNWQLTVPSFSVTADLRGVPLHLDWVLAACDGGAELRVRETVTVDYRQLYGQPRYTTLGALKLYARAGGLPGQTAPVGEDDEALLEAIARAEDTVDAYCGTRFDYDPERVDICDDVVVDRGGLLHLHVTRPIAALTTVEVMGLPAAGSWSPIGYSTEMVDGRVAQSATPRAESYRARVLPDSALSPSGRYRYLARVTYEAGYRNIPVEMRALVNRVAWWYAKLRDVPVGSVQDVTSGTLVIPQGFPKDALGQMRAWRDLP